MVFAYSLFETILLLSIDAVNLRREPFESAFAPMLLSLIQCLVIPGLAALFSRLLYGNRDLPKRLLKIFLTVPLGLIAFAALIVVLAVTSEYMTDVNLPSWIDTSVSVLIGIGLLVAVAWIFLRAFMRSGNYSVQLEAESWLAQRKSFDTRQRRLRRRAIQGALCIPVITGLLTFVFLFPVLGLLSHVVDPHASPA